MGVATPKGGGTDPTAVASLHHPRALRKRLVIMCPETRLSVDTGLDLSAIPNLRGSQILFDCMECGQDHAWSIDEAHVD
jgi:hypothetical protein